MPVGIRVTRDMAGLNMFRTQVHELMGLAGSSVEVGWPEGEEGVTDHIRDKAKWLEYGTRNQRPRPFMEPVSRRSERAGPIRLHNHIVDILHGRTSVDRVLEEEGEFWFRELFKELQRLSLRPEFRLKESTVERKLRKGAPFPEKVGYEFGDLVTAMTYRVVDVRA